MNIFKEGDGNVFLELADTCKI